MKKGKQVLIMSTIAILVQMSLYNCAGGHVSDNGLFQSGHKELKNSLLGSWVVSNSDKDLLGEEFFSFSNGDKSLMLEVNGIEKQIERFDSADGLSFSFEYLDDQGERIYVLGQFKSFAKQSLVLMQENSSIRSSGSLWLERGQGQKSTVVAANTKD